MKEELGVGSRRTLERINEHASFDAVPKLIKTLDQHGLAEGSVANDEPDWVFLGRYRTAANRGGGFIYCYLLKNAVPIMPLGGTERFQQSGDDEAQKLRFLNMKDMRRAIKDGQFQEVKWAATLSLSMLHLDDTGNS